MFFFIWLIRLVGILSNCRCVWVVWISVRFFVLSIVKNFVWVLVYFGMSKFIRGLLCLMMLLGVCV